VPISYQIDQDSGTLFVKMSGEILPQELVRHWAALTEDLNVQSVSHALTDIRESTPVFTGPELWKILDDHFRETIDQMAIRQALLVANDQQEQAARKWIAIVPATIVARVFYDRDQALEWLKGVQ
jgi:hypothetical protein